MAPPAIKRRKLEHSESEAESDGSFADFDETNGGVESDGSDAENAQNESDDVSMDGAQEIEDDDDDMSEDGKDDSKVERSTQESKRQAVDGKVTSTAKPLKRPALSLQDGVYTAESFKSNMFKLQVDELLDQVKLKYGKKEAPAENAMRTLKNIIEQIPSRDPLLVRQYFSTDSSVIH